MWNSARILITLRQLTSSHRAPLLPNSCFDASQTSSHLQTSWTWLCWKKFWSYHGFTESHPQQTTGSRHLKNPQFRNFIRDLFLNMSCLSLLIRSKCRKWVLVGLTCLASWCANCSPWGKAPLQFFSETSFWHIKTSKIEIQFFSGDLAGAGTGLGWLCLDVLVLWLIILGRGENSGRWWRADVGTWHENVSFGG